MAHKEQRRKKTLPLLLAALTLAGAGLWWGNYTLSVEEYAFSSSRLPPGWDGGRLVVLSDLHGRQFGRDNRRLAAAVEAAHPDVIALVGDFVDEWTDPAYLRPLLERLTALAPCYFVSGNHEWAARKDAGNGGPAGGLRRHLAPQRLRDASAGRRQPAPGGHRRPQRLRRPENAPAGGPGGPDAAPEGFWLLLAHGTTCLNRNTPPGADRPCRATATAACGVCPLPTGCWEAAARFCPPIPTDFIPAGARRYLSPGAWAAWCACSTARRWRC